MLIISVSALIILLPVPAEHGFAATVFVPTGWLRGAYDEGGALDTMLGWGQVRELAATGVGIGGHSHTRPRLDQLDDRALRAETVRCRETVTAELGKVPVSFAYPYGYSSRRVRRAVRAAGFAQSPAVGNAMARRRQGPYALERVTVRRGTGTAAFARLVEGGRSPVRSSRTGRSPRGSRWCAAHAGCDGRSAGPHRPRVRPDPRTARRPDPPAGRRRPPGGPGRPRHGPGVRPGPALATGTRGLMKPGARGGTVPDHGRHV